MSLLDKITGFREFCNRSMDNMNPLISEIEIIEKQIVTEMEEMISSMKDLLQKFPESAGWTTKCGSKNLDDVKEKQNQLGKLNKKITKLNKDIAESIKHHRKNSDSFILLVFGKVNAGKSTFANTLVGWNLPEISQEDFNFGAINEKEEEVAIRCFEENETECTNKIQWCSIGSLKIIDTPGLDSMTTKHHELADEHSKFADLILYVMNSDRQGGEDFKHIIELCDKGKRVIPLITRSDECDRDKENTYDEYQPPKPEDRKKQEQYLCERFTSEKDDIKDCLYPDEICSISSKLARNGILKPDIEYQKSSNFFKLIDILQKVISEEGPKLRIDSPCNTLLNYVKTTEAVCEDFFEHFKKLRESLKKNERKLEILRVELTEDCKEIFDTIETEFNKAELNIEKFLDEIFRWKRMVKAIFRTKKAKQDLEQKFSEMVLSEEDFKGALIEAAESVQKKMEKRIEKFISDIKNEFSNFSKMDSGLSVEIIAADLLMNVFNMIVQLIYIWLCGAIGGMIVEIAELILIETAITSSFSIFGTIIGGGVGLIIGGFLLKSGTGEAKDAIRADISMQLKEVKERIIYGDPGIKEAVNKIIEDISNHIKKELMDKPTEFINELEMCVEKFSHSLSSKRDDIEKLKSREIFN